MHYPNSYRQQSDASSSELQAVAGSVVIPETHRNRCALVLVNSLPYMHLPVIGDCESSMN